MCQCTNGLRATRSVVALPPRRVISHRFPRLAPESARFVVERHGVDARQEPHIRSSTGRVEVDRLLVRVVGAPSPAPLGDVNRLLDDGDPEVDQAWSRATRYRTRRLDADEQDERSATSATTKQRSGATEAGQHLPMNPASATYD